MLPVWWGKNQKGMSAAEQISPEDIETTETEWLELAEITRSYVERWNARGLHKQIANRPLEWFSWHTAIITGTYWDGLLRQRAPESGPMDPNFPAQPEFQEVVVMLRDLLAESNPRVLAPGEWHRPLVSWDDEIEVEDALDLNKVSVARCARVSYLTHDGRRDLSEDLGLYDRLVSQGHWSPFEHVAQAKLGDDLSWSGNLQGWLQFRELVDPHFVRVGAVC
jgi:hypothetical protein